jgi:hypothetical protein
MKTWCKAVCDTHGEAIDIFVTNPSCTAAYLSKYDEEIQVWIEEHGHCGPRLISNDIQLDALWLAGYVCIDGLGHGLKRYRRQAPHPDHEFTRDWLYTHFGCSVCGKSEEEHLIGRKDVGSTH